MFKKNTAENYVIFSPLEGVLMQDGKPLPNAKIIRTLKWNGNEEGLVEEFTSDSQGHFSLPLFETELSLGMLDQFAAKTELGIDIDGKYETFWYNNKLLPEMHAETDGKVDDLVCDIKAEETAVFLGESVVPNILTKCRWTNMPEN